MKKFIRQLAYGVVCLSGALLVSCDKEDDEMFLTQPPLSISMTRGGTQLAVPTKGNYTVDQEKTYLKIPLGVSLSTVTLDTFSVNVAVNNDTISELIANGALANMVLLPEGSYMLPTSVIVPANTISAPLNLLVNFNTLIENQGKKLALAVRITDPSSHSLTTSKSITVVVIDTDAVIAASEIGDVTAKYLVNTGYPFISTERETPGGRWGNLNGWTANGAAKSHNGYGGFNSDAGGTLGLEAGWGSPEILNGKLYQTTTLPAGKYAFEIAEWDWKGMQDPAYLVVAEGAGLPDYAAVEEGALSYSNLAGSVVEFTLEEQKEVSIGIVVNFPASGQGFKVKRVQLTRLE
ncbi:DUF5013 domain-containing protein [Pontibacter sp. E15-1]|uniref:DUF5013 domain-containing protein n=1 Tax=Pontibacter sp. E15-1 TaxID=2919918 RepID=UPI001F4FAC90|nr:DUF5013 domain-containing protein [Pontibacter sp. E15-1]MCJ8164305.1 DUF5013 domain-containing protein [Pontibacter sp. E15-1]